MICRQEDLGELRKENGKFRIHNKKSVLRSFATLEMTLPLLLLKNQKVLDIHELSVLYQFETIG